VQESPYRFRPEKPLAQLTGEDGNVFAVIARVARALKRAGEREQADEFVQRALQAKSYGEVLLLCEEYVEVS
jgi:hypothetical protein